MASAKLTNMIRDGILSRMKKELFTKKEELIKKKMVTIAVRAWDAHLGKGISALLETIPEGFLDTTTTVKMTYTCSPKSQLVSSHKKQFQVTVPQQYCRLHEYNHHCEPASVRDRRRFDELIMELDRLHTTWSQVENEAKAALFTCTTSKVLLETWPEVSEWYKPSGLNKLLPMVPVEDLNKRVAMLRAG